MMTKAQAPVLIWFREDLRLADHAAVSAAAAAGAPVVPLYVLDTDPARRPLGAASLWWLDKSLRALAAALERSGSRLILRRGSAAEIVSALAVELGASAVHWSRSVEAFGRAQDAALTQALAAAGIAAHPVLTHLAVDPDTTRTGSGGPFRVYGAFRKAVAPKLTATAPLPAPAHLAPPGTWPPSDDVDSWALHPTAPDWSTGFSDWVPGEAGARDRLDRFLDGRLADYGLNRDLPHVEGTTRLSPHLRFGEISPRQILCAAEAAAAANPELEAAQDKLSAEVAWREFSYHLLAANPDVSTVPLRPAFTKFPFRSDAKALTAFTQGRTGYPVVDAGMRQLWETGWMHNRVRLIAASFLVKHLLIDWREGERWFWDTLVDADPANNPASWQWIAGSGVDASPYFRIFNPVTQGERFDPDGAYVSRFVPELAKLPKRHIHQPWTAPAELLRTAGVTLGRTYPKPMIDHAEARKRALAAFAAMREETASAD